MSEKREEKMKQVYSIITEVARLAAEAISKFIAVVKEKMDEAQELKILPEYYEAVKAGLKPFEVRSIKDRAFTVGDMLNFREYDGKAYTGRSILACITYILDGGGYGIDPDYAVLGIKVLNGGVE